MQVTSLRAPRHTHSLRFVRRRRRPQMYFIHTHIDPHTQFFLAAPLIPLVVVGAPPSDDDGTPSKLAALTPISHLRAMDGDDGLEACMHRLTAGSRPRAVALILDLCRQLAIEDEVCTQLACVSYEDGPLEAIINGTLSSLHAQDEIGHLKLEPAVEPVPSCDPPPSHMTCETSQSELQADYWKRQIEPAPIRSAIQEEYWPINDQAP